MKQRVVAPLVVFVLLLSGAWFIYRSHRAEVPSPADAKSLPAGATGPESASHSDAPALGYNPGRRSATGAPLTTPPTVPPAMAGVSQLPPVQVIPTSQRPQNSAVPAYAAPLSPGGNNAHADQDLEKINRMLRDYRTLMGENPVGTNAEIMKSIMGDNPRKAQLLQDGVNLNGSGEIVDPWGNPYFFHQLSGTLMEVRSAGPDGIMWTGDDIVRK